MALREKFTSYKIGMVLYRFLGGIFFRLGGLRILKRKYKNDISERLGQISGVPEGAVWIHAVSVGEVQSASSLIRRIKRKSPLPCVLSTVTITGRDMALRLLASGAVEKIFYSPFDTKKFVTQALDNIKPLIYISMETELWPEMFAELKARKIPAFLANGRISEKSFKRLRRTKWFWRGVLDALTKLMVRFEEDKEKFIALGVPPEKIIVTGDCKVDALLDRRKITGPERWEWLRRNDAPLFVAGSTHQGEDEIVISAFRIVRRKFPDARLIIVPRHPERALMTVASVLPYQELNAELLSQIENDKRKLNDVDVIAVDRIGILFELYAVADAVFIGGSLVEKGGQNPFEPALFGLPAIHGPCMTDFPDTERMDDMGAAVRVSSDTELAKAWEERLDAGAASKALRDCDEYFKTLGGAAKKTWSEIEEQIGIRNKKTS
ncbi:MAG: glycosyltransferase N-terminal domain-containing protein [Synergistales bacterium]|nr:glycosyltransferase N-terminal domain-containing protein [Synergistales bacterium]MDY6401216.1 glycosyltransferase N-terminal domain-containing protein [Synergistales bacterium]MDY6404444.1 glycosyltransferase N-terminal domain-containing protein [Synergistales bacterium]MDY6410197.1 glycosyltransferase N-terminal domain-containing protein [Synergistales bacterium]MDY6414949.1 glycosyltransferase N-terminal domain-containing protein [Synergistales bacterium]